MALERHKGKCILYFLTICAFITTSEAQVSGCKEGYFGYNCLYRNEFNYKSYKFAELADGRYDTCVNEATTLTITFTLTRVLFVRLIVKNNTQYKDVVFTFKTGDSCKTCNGSFLLNGTNIVEYHCSCLVTSDGLTISNIGRKPVCHIEVTEGRNMVSQSTIKAAPVITDKAYFSFNGLIDERIDSNANSCYYSILPSWNNVTTVFNQPVFVNVIELYDMSPDFRSLLNAELSLLDVNEYPIWTLKITGVQERRRFINDKPNTEVHTVSIKQFKYMAMCEMRFFGDCPPGKYGLNCTECSKNCGQDGSCDMYGICYFGCQQGYQGERCTEIRSDFRTSLVLSQPSYKSGVCRQGLVEIKETYSLSARVMGKLSPTRRNLLGFEIMHKFSLYFKPLCSIQLNSPCGVSQEFRICYCKNNTKGVLEIVLNKTAELMESEATVRVSSFLCGVRNYSNNVSLPVIYGNDVASLYLGFLPLDLAKCRVTLKPNAVLRFCVKNLVSYTLAVTFAYDKTTSSLECLEHFFEYDPAPKSREFNVSYKENVGCMRSKSYTCQWYYKELKRSTYNLANKKVMSFTWLLMLLTSIEVLLH